MTIKKRFVIIGISFIVLAATILAVYLFLFLLKHYINNKQGETLNKGNLSSIYETNTLFIPKIGVKIEIVEGSDESTLDKGAWRMPQTSTPDKGGNTVLSAHRWKYLPPSEETFYLLDKLGQGDEFQVIWEKKQYNYKVVSVSIVLPTDLSVLDPTENPSVTLLTCHPLFSTQKRLIVRGELVSKE